MAKSNAKIKIGVNVSSLLKQANGISRYTMEMCKALTICDDIELYLYSPSRSEAISQFENLPNVVIKYANFTNPITKQFWHEFYLPNWLKKDEVDVFWSPAHRFPYLLPKDLASVVTIHDLTWKYYPETMQFVTYWLDRVFMPIALKKATRVVAISQATAQSLIEEFDIDKKISVIHLGSHPVDTQHSDNCLKELGIEQDYLLFVGTLEPRKNLITLLEAYSLLPEKVKTTANLVIAGGKGWGNLALSNIIDKLQLNSYVKLVGSVDDKTLQQLYAHTLFLAMPSLYEGFGLPIIEANAHGKAVLTSNTSSMPEVAGKSGLLIAPLDMLSIKEGLYALLTNEELRKSYADKAISNAKRFNWQQAGAQLVDVFKEAIELKKQSYPKPPFKSDE